jgi:hypothetical protein
MPTTGNVYTQIISRGAVQMIDVVSGRPLKKPIVKRSNVAGDASRMENARRRRG